MVNAGGHTGIILTVTGDGDGDGDGDGVASFFILFWSIFQTFSRTTQCPTHAQGACIATAAQVRISSAQPCVQMDNMHLTSASHALCKTLAHFTHLRHAPSLHFRRDELSPEQASVLKAFDAIRAQLQQQDTEEEGELDPPQQRPRRHSSGASEAAPKSGDGVQGERGRSGEERGPHRGRGRRRRRRTTGIPVLDALSDMSD